MSRLADPWWTPPPPPLPPIRKKSHRVCPREEDYWWFRLGWKAGCVSSTVETMSVGRLVGRLVGWLAGRLVGFDPHTPRSRRILGEDNLPLWKQSNCDCSAFSTVQAWAMAWRWGNGLRRKKVCSMKIRCTWLFSVEVPNCRVKVAGGIVL